MIKVFVTRCSEVESWVPFTDSRPDVTGAPTPDALACLSYSLLALLKHGSLSQAAENTYLHSTHSLL